MLENENGTPADSLPQPPAPRRRSASRAAGPPPAVAAPSDVPQTSAAPVDATATAAGPPEVPKRTRRATRSSAPADEAAPSDTTEAVAPKTRRAPARSSAKAVPATEDTAAPTPADVNSENAVPVTASEEKPKRTRRSPKAATESAPSEPVSSTETTSAPFDPSAIEASPVVEFAPAEPAPRRRRAATRPASAPANVSGTPSQNDASAAAAPSTRAAADIAPDAPATETVGGEQDEPPVRRRRAASRPAGGPAARAPEAPAAQATPSEDETPSTEKPATRRRRSSRESAPVATSTDDSGNTDGIGAALDALSAEIASSRGKQTSKGSEDSDVSEEKPSSRRRRSGRPAATAPVDEDTGEDQADAPVDGITAALKMAEADARSRRALVADPFRVTAENRQAHLDDLAQSIASGVQDDASGEDEDSDEAVTDESVGEDLDDDSNDDDAAHDDDSHDDESGDDTQDSEGEGGGNRRRRRRGGRRRRRGGSNNRDEQDPDDSSSEDSGSEDEDNDGDQSPDSGRRGNDRTQESAARTKADDDSDSDDADDSDGEDSSNGTTRRRRRRRRSGNDGSPDSSKGTGEDAITGIEGSTRMAAKRQRRQDNRAAGRRRAPILSEAEFLARRESVDRKLIIRQGEEYTQLAVVEDNILVEHYVDRASAMSLIGNVYMGKVQNVLPSMEAAFVDIGRGRNAVLYAGEVDWSGFSVSAADRKVEKVFKSGQSVLVQVTKDPVGAKGARLTGHISLPGRYVVYSPGGHLSGISRKLPDSERSRLREILGGVIGDDESVIVRTAAEGASSEELVRDVNRLKAQWEVIEKKTSKGSAPAALYSEPDLTLRIVRDLFTEDFGALVVQGNGGPEDSFDEINAYVAHVAPNLADRVQHYQVDDKGHDAFAEYRIDEQIAKALDRKVHLPSGGSLVIDRTEAMTVIDVNTGRFTGAGGNLETTVTSNNLEAAEEVVRQLRLRDIGGIIVVDFIDMVLPSNRDLLLRRLVECLGRDRTRHQVAEVTSLGLVQLTRKKIGTGLAEAFTEECEHCHGDGYLRFHEPVDSQAPSDGGDRRSNGGGNSGGGGGNRRGGRNRRGGNGNGNNNSDGGNSGDKTGD